MICHYPVKTLIGDYLRGGIGLAATGGLVGFASMITVIQYIIAAAAIMFAGFLLRTWQRHRTHYVLDDIGVQAIGPFGRAIRWSDISGLGLRYFSTRRDRKDGWFQLTIRGGFTKMSIDSNLDGFDEVLRRCAIASHNNGLELKDGTVENFAAAGFPVRDAAPDQPVRAC